MGKIKEVSLVKLICGLISNKVELFDKTTFDLSSYFGEIDYQSENFLFDQTNYYEEEMGKDLFRRFISFKELINRERLAEVKRITNEVEKCYSQNNKRMVNLDPGYFTYSNLVLASTKNYFHRIYIGKDIFAEVTLYYTKGKFNFLPWTYPDYKKQEYLDSFLEIRKIYQEQIKEIEKHH
ncbi:DUF4416 family protein [bacterium]|nr:DUF4416 family protein [bacterium]